MSMDKPAPWEDDPSHYDYNNYTLPDDAWMFMNCVSGTCIVCDTEVGDLGILADESVAHLVLPADENNRKQCLVSYWQWDVDSEILMCEACYDKAIITTEIGEIQ